MTINAPVTIKFKNIFDERKTFEFLANSNLDFDVKPTSQDIDSQQVRTIFDLRKINNDNNSLNNRLSFLRKST